MGIILFLHCVGHWSHTILHRGQFCTTYIITTEKFQYVQKKHSSYKHILAHTINNFLHIQACISQRLSFHRGLQFIRSIFFTHTRVYTGTSLYYYSSIFLHNICYKPIVVSVWKRGQTTAISTFFLRSWVLLAWRFDFWVCDLVIISQRTTYISFKHSCLCIY